MLQLYPSPFATCDFMVRFPDGCRWINGCRKCLSPLAIVPASVGFFRSGNAAVAARYFYRYLIVAVLVVISQPFKAKKRVCSVANPFGAPAGALFSCRYFI